MGSGIYIAAAGAESQAAALDVTANNIANAATTGFKAERVSFRQALDSAQSADATYVEGSSKADDQTAGSLVQTSNPLDLALVGDGYFSVETDAGTRYTRAGAFRLDAAGAIINAAGQKALSNGGGPLTVPPEASQVSVTATGEVFADGESIGSLALSRFSPGAMKREGASLFSTTAAPLDGTPEVVSGALESSNVNVVRGMVDLVKVSRTYESLLRMIEGYRETESRAARDLGGPK